MKKRKKFNEYEKKYLEENICKYNKYIPFEYIKNLEYYNINSNSWFDINKANISKKLKFKIKININNNNNNDKILKCKKIIILPTDKQTDILLSWFESYRKMYNDTLIIIKRLIKEKNKKMFNFQYIRTYKMKEIKQKYINLTKINSHILDGAIKLACTSYKSAVTNYRKGYIKHFRIRFIKQSKKSKILDLEKCYFSKEGFCIKYLGKMLNNENFDYSNIKKDSKLHYNSINKRFTLLIPIEEKCKNLNNKKLISIDPGIKTFLTGISNNNTYKIGTNIIDNIKDKLLLIDKYKSINNKKSRKRALNIYTKIYNKITDLHWKSINYLITKENIGCILIGNWSTKNISSNSNNTNNKLLPIYKRLASSLRYYSFLQKLKYKCNKYNIIYNITDESFTSKICCYCGLACKINKNTRCLECQCKTNLDRDINGCINILFKNL